MVDFYNRQLKAYEKATQGKTKGDALKVDDFVDNDPKKISWTVNLKADLGRGKRISLSPKHSAHGMYRPFNKQWLYFDRSLIERVLQMPKLFPKPGIENTVISVTGVGASKGFSALIVSVIPNLHLHDTGQCFPLYVYEEAADGGTDWATTDGTVVDG